MENTQFSLTPILMRHLHQNWCFLSYIDLKAGWYRIGDHQYGIFIVRFFGSFSAEGLL